MMLVLLFFAIWTICAIVTYGIARAMFPEEIEDAEIIYMLTYLCAWPLSIIMFVGYAVLKRLALIGEFVGGFLRGFINGVENETD